MSSRMPKIPVRLLLLSAATFVLAGTFVPCAVAQDAKPQLKLTTMSFANIGEGRMIRSILTSALNAGRVDDVTFANGGAMRSAYAANDGGLLWLDRDNVNVLVPDFIALFEESWTHGLNPNVYHLDEIRSLAESPLPRDRARLDLLISDAVMRFGRDVTGMRVDPGKIGQRSEYWRAPSNEADVLTTVFASSQPVVALKDFAPKGALYDRLRQELVTLSRSPERENDTAGPMKFDGLLRPGESHANVPRLRARMGQSHDPAYGGARYYDDALAAATMRFQTHHGLSADGVVGPKTLALLNRSVKDRMEQIVANIERLRWLDQEKPQRYILVNIPSATLWAVDGESVAAQMPVIVGRADRKTNSFTTEITGIRFNPKWNVPTTIKTQDYLPRLKQDPYYLQDKGIEVYRVVDGRRETVDPASVDWANMTRAGLSRLNMQQGAGDNNALGRIRILMDNRYDIYLHDTNAPGLFAQNDRMLSSGCVRMSDPGKVANFILNRNEGWSDARMHSIIDRGTTTEVKAAEPIPVYLLYQTIWLDSKGQLVYGPDVYREDRRLLAALKATNGYAFPDKDGLKFASIAITPTVQ